MQQTITLPMTSTSSRRGSNTATDENRAPSHYANQQTNIKVSFSSKRNTGPSISCDSTGQTPYFNRILKPPKDCHMKSQPKLPKPSQLNRDVKTTLLEPATLPAMPSLCNYSINSNSFSLPEVNYNNAKIALSPTTMSSRLVGRLTEKKEVSQFFHAHVLNPEAGFSFIQGRPGTGKTTLLKEVINDLKPEMRDADHSIKILTVNCKNISLNIYGKLLQGMGYSYNSNDNDVIIETLESIVLGGTTKVVYVVILDKVDYLLAEHRDVLNQLTQWSATQGSKLTLIGVTSIVDISELLDHGLKSTNYRPNVIFLRPYKTQEIKNIIVDRLISISSNDCVGDYNESDIKMDSLTFPLMLEAAIELCASKVSEVGGDICKALDICRHSLEIMEAEEKLRKRKPMKKEETRSNKRTKIMPLQEITLADIENRIAGGVRLPQVRPRPVNSTCSHTISPQRPRRSHSNCTPNGKDTDSRHLKAVVDSEHVKRAIAKILNSPTNQLMR